MFVMESVDDLWDHIAYVLGYAPDRFPHRDFLPADEQMNLDRAFDQLRQGVTLAYPEPEAHAKRRLLNELLDASYAAYQAGDEIKAGKMLNSFEDAVFKR
ncbi:MAG: hypothetical protein ACOVMO_08555 [Caulobacter sp.]